MKKHFLIMAFVMINSINMLFGIDSNPSMSRIYGTQYTPGIADTQLPGQLGYLVPSGIFGTNGSLSLAAQVPGAQAAALQVLDTGMIAVLCNDTSNSYMVQYTAQGAVNTNFATSTGNKLTLSNLKNPALSMTIDKQNRFLISGSDDASSLPWIRRITPAGGVDTTFTFVDGVSWTASGVINQLGIQTSGKIIAVGHNGTYAMVARYNLDGSIDGTFNAGGYVILNGGASGSATLPTSTTPLQNVIIDAQNNIYCAYLASSSSVAVIRLTQTGLIDTSWHSGTPVNLSYLTGSALVSNQLRMIRNALGDIIVAIPSGTPTVIKATSINAADGTAGTFVNFTTSGGVFSTNSYSLFALQADSNGYVYLLGSNLTTVQMTVIRCTSAGILDTAFHNGTGVNFFWPAGSAPSSFANINTASLAPDGQIFTAGAQLDSGTTTPYVSSLYNNQYALQVAQFPQTQEQGTTDITFGLTGTENYLGVVSPYIGLYRASLQQKIETVTELINGYILVGMNGYTNTNNYTSMMLVRLNAAGLIDTTFGGGTGKIVIPNLTTGVSEYITNVLEDGSGNLYVSGYSSAGALFRKYDSTGTLIWNSDYLVAGYQGLGTGFESATQAFLFLGGPSNTGQIKAYSATDGTTDTSFHSAGSTPGTILATDFPSNILNLGPLHNGVISESGNIFVAYKNTVTSKIDVASIVNSGAGVAWVTTNIFSAYPVTADNVRVAFNNDGNIVVAASYGTNFLVSVLNISNGQKTPHYNSPLVIPCGTSLQLKQVIGISDNTIILVGCDTAGDGAMLAVRVSDTGTLDTTFDAQGPVPGIVSLKVGDQIADFYARVASGITVQSHTGINQGNLILAGYEQMFSTSATPMILRLFGMPGTTQVKSFPLTTVVAGGFDTTYGGGDGIAQTYVLGATTPAANQEVRSMRELIGTQIMTVITDNTTSISYTQRLNADGSIDTTYGDGLGIAITKLAGTEAVNNMVFDSLGNMLVVGSNDTYGGYLKRIFSNGNMDPLFGGYTGASASAAYPVGTAYGLMDSVNACQELTNGNIVVVGSLQGVGTIQVLNATGSVVTNFGIAGQVMYGVNATSVSVDPSNNMYIAIAYLDTDMTTKKAGILKLDSNGNPVTTFGVNGFVSSAIANIDNYNSLRTGFDTAYNVIIAASFGNANGKVAVNRFTATGGVDMTFHSGSQLEIEFPTATNVIVTGLVVLQDDKVLVSGYQQDDSTPAFNMEFIACVDVSGELDANFGAGSIPGLVTFQIAGAVQLARRLTDLNVQTDGNILLCGGEVPVVDQETPLTFRLYGYPDVQPVPQFTGLQLTLPSPLNIAFNPTGAIPGISPTPIIPNVSQLGNIVVDSSGFALVGGVTSTGLFVVVRYLRDGLLDPDFGIDGVAQSTTPITDLAGGYLAVDADDNIYIGAIGSTQQLIVARLNFHGELDPDFGTGGVAVSATITNLSGGGFVTVDSTQKPLVGGYTSDGNLVVTRFTTAGGPDSTFASGNYASIAVAGLTSGGSLVTNRLNNVFIGGLTLDGNMTVVKLDATGSLATYGTSGIASTGVISGLIDGGSVGLDSNNNIVIGGLTSNQVFVVARFLATGFLDPLFNEQGVVPGIAYSKPLDILNVFGNLTIDSNDNVITGGTAVAYDGSKSMIITRFTSVGNLDTILSTFGMATTGAIPNFSNGGVVATDVYDNIFMAGLTDLPGFVVAQMYSGQEIFIADPNELSPRNFTILYYGNSKPFLYSVLAPEFYGDLIVEPIAQTGVLANVIEVIEAYYLTYYNQPGWNTVWHAYRMLANLEESRIALNILYPDHAYQIDSFFTKFSARIESMRFGLLLD